MQHDAQDLKQSSMRAHDAEEATCRNQIRGMSIDDDLPASNIIRRYKIYNFKYNNDPTRML